MTTKFRSQARRTGGAAVLALAMLACNVDTLLDVPDPDVATPASVQDKSALPAVLAAAIGDFMVAYNGTGDSQISLSGLFTDELIWAETFPTRFEVDARSIQVVNGTTEGVFRNLHRARVSAQRASEAYQRLDPALIAPFAEALNLEAFTYIFFGENYCNGVPVSTFDPTAGAVHGAPMSNDSMFLKAVTLFDSALTLLGTNTAAAAVTQRNFAAIGKGRALMNRNQAAAAATAVAAVPTAFSYVINHSDNTGRQNNGLFSLVFEGRRFSVGQLEGGTGMPFRADSLDPRTPSGRGTGALAFGFDGATALFTQRKHLLRTTTAPVVTGAEARLIEAEANLRVGGATTWLATLNTLRGTAVPALAALVDPGTAATRENLVFRERAYWLWLTSHRLGDMRRLVRQLGRPVNTVYPTGAYFKGGLYGSDVNFPIPFDELNNEKFKECTDRNA